MDKRVIDSPVISIHHPTCYDFRELLVTLECVTETSISTSGPEDSTLPRRQVARSRHPRRPSEPHHFCFLGWSGNSSRGQSVYKAHERP